MIYDFCNFGNGTNYSLLRIFLESFLKETTSVHQLLKRRPQKLLNEFIRLPEKTKMISIFHSKPLQPDRHILLHANAGGCSKDL